MALFQSNQGLTQATDSQTKDNFDRFFSCVEQMSHSVFEEFSRALLEAEGVRITEVEVCLPGDSVFILDAIGEVSFREPSGVLRVEAWGFEFKRYREERVSVAHLHSIESKLQMISTRLDLMCFVTTGHSTSLAEEFVANNPRLRLWDRTVIGAIAERHPKIVENYCGLSVSINPQSGVPAAPSTSTGSGDLIASHPILSGAGTATLPSVAFRQRLEAIPAGQATYAWYEKSVNEVLSYIFADTLGEPKPQTTTIDGAQRRDTLYKNKQAGPFWRRIFHKFDADFIIVDAKNYGDPIDPGVIQDAEKYANKAIGMFILVVSRRGPNANVEKAQLRTWRDRGIMILAVSDDQLIEMVRRKENGLLPEDLLDDALDSLLIRF